MSKNCHLLGAVNDGGGVHNGPQQSNTYVNDKLVSIDGDGVSGHLLHAPPVTANGSATVFCNDKPVNRLGDADTCGHVRNSAHSPDLFIGP